MANAGGGGYSERHREKEKKDCLVDKAPRLSIRIVIWILPSDTGDDLYNICFDYPNRETAMLSTLLCLH